LTADHRPAHENDRDLDHTRQGVGVVQELRNVFIHHHIFVVMC